MIGVSSPATMGQRLPAEPCAEIAPGCGLCAYQRLAIGTREQLSPSWIYDHGLYLQKRSSKGTSRVFLPASLPALLWELRRLQCGRCRCLCCLSGRLREPAMKAGARNAGTMRAAMRFVCSCRAWRLPARYADASLGESSPCVVIAFDDVFEAEDAMRDAFMVTVVDRYAYAGRRGFAYPACCADVARELAHDIIEHDADYASRAVGSTSDELSAWWADRQGDYRRGLPASGRDEWGHRRRRIVGDCLRAEPVRELATVEALRLVRGSLNVRWRLTLPIS